MSKSGFNLKDVLKVVGTSFISLTIETDVKLPGGKKNPLQGQVTKKSTMNVMVFSNKNVNTYQNMVNRRLEKEGKQSDFVVGERSWGVRIPNTPFVEHNGQFYLDVIVKSTSESDYFVNGRKVDVEDEYEFTYLVEDKVRLTEVVKTKVSEESQGGLEDKVIIRTVKIENIKSLTHNGATFTKVYYE